MRCWGELKSFKLIFSATQRCNIVATLFRIVTTLFQHCNAVLRKESSLRIVSCNITTDINTAVSLKSNVAKIYLSFQVNFALPSKSILLFPKKKKKFCISDLLRILVWLLCYFHCSLISKILIFGIYIYQITEVKHVRIAEFFSLGLPG